MKPVWIPMHRLLAAGRPAKTTVARRPEGNYLWSDFEGHVAGLCAQLAKAPRGRWLLSCDSAYAFSVGLLALWQTGRVAVLPPNAQPDSLRESARGARGVISDSSAVPGLRTLSPLAVRAKTSSWTLLNPARARLELFTSGSTGSRRGVPKTLVQLENELSVLEKTFGARLGGCVVHASVSHHHIYGLLFRLLWPLSAGRPFADAPFLLWDELARLPRRASVCLVASPAHLERLSPAGERVLRQISVRAVFSSGGPLRDSAVERVRALTGKSPVEVFGSTETGGVGWRARQVRDDAWRPFDGVSVSIDNSKNSRLRVTSPFSATRGWLPMGDRGRVFPDGRFSVEGRTDRIVKIAEKRLSLDDMERRLLGHAEVKAVRVIVLEPQAGESRAALGAAVVLNAAGVARLKRAGRAIVTAGLRDYLKKSFDAATLPRAFRFIAALPTDALGKASLAVLNPLFQTDAEPPVTAPELLKKTRSKTRLQHRVRVPETLVYLKGHFPGHPIVPGVVQIQWVVAAATDWLGARPIVRRMDAMKFKTPLLAGQEFSIHVERAVSETESLLRFSLLDGDTLFSSGRLVLA